MAKLSQTRKMLSQALRAEFGGGLVEPRGQGGVLMGEKHARSSQAHAAPEEQTAPELFEVSGCVKWFDPSKGYGFIVPDDGRPDILLHLSCLRRGGFKVVREGARVVCEVQKTAKGLQVFRIRCMDDSTAINPLQLPQRTRVVVAPKSGWERAVVKWFNRRHGFGFLSRGPAKPEIFVHMETLRRWGFTELQSGQTVLVRYGRGPSGLIAAEIKPENSAEPSSH